MMRRKNVLLTAAVTAALLAATTTVADDGGNGTPGSTFQKSMSRKLPPGGEAEHAFIDVINRYVDAQAAGGTLLDGVEHYNIDGDLVETVTQVRPQIGVFIHGPVEHVHSTQEIGFSGHGKRDAYAAVSLDDGDTWKLTNLSESADRSSADFDRTDVDLYADDGINYPGDVLNIFQATAGDRMLVAWYSRYCSSGQPNYALASGDTERRDAIAAYLGVDLSVPSPDDIYLWDMFQVAGQQDSVDYAQDKFPQNQPVGEVPYACLWAARGTLEMLDDGTHAVVWRKAERLTSGRRDVARVEVAMVEGAGAVITWQEDPEGLRPGQGLGPGAGWSGAVANHQTDVWYSFIEWEHFEQVQQEDESGEIVPYAEYAGLSNRPKVGIPMAMPMRVTDNAKCNVGNPVPYCNGSAINNDGIRDEVLNPLDYGMRDMCADTVEIPAGQGNATTEVCVTEDGLPLVGNLAATRPRVNLFGYDSDLDGATDSAWVVFVAEESKGLGNFLNDDGERFDVGKNMWYYSFSMSLFDSRVTEDNGLLAALAGHGNMLNQPAKDWQTGEFFPLANTAEFWDFGTYNYDLYETEIARRGSLLAQPADNATRPRGLVAFPTWKQGILEQGGPADVMARRILRQPGYDDMSHYFNPYAFTNMDCEDWAYKDGSNPYYPDGLCLESAINLSSVTPDTCVDTTDGGTVDCPTVDLATGIGDTDPVLQGGDVGTPNTTKVLTWHQCPFEAALVSSSTTTAPVLDCEDSASNRADNRSDQSWYNPLDVAKGHRGFLDRDFMMILYAWSPNWKLNTRGKDRYELYIRRSFDGGESWTTLPKNYLHAPGDTYKGAGMVSCETYRTAETGNGGEAGPTEPRACFEYEAKTGKPGSGAEQARNVSQLKSMRFTILDPRYAPTAPSVPEAARFDEDERDPSRYFVVYETGDNSTVAAGEAEPLNLLYSRAVHFGDNYQVWAEEDDTSVCYPSDPHDDPDVMLTVLENSGFCNEFDELEGKRDILSSEASLEANPGGQWLYGVWSQEDTGDGSSDAMWRRVWYLDDYISADYAWDVVGQGPQ